ncbi:Type II secretion system (T2SS), protein E, N-terminal domain, partial [Trinickia caryophylli]
MTNAMPMIEAVGTDVPPLAAAKAETLGARDTGAAAFGTAASRSMEVEEEAVRLLSYAFSRAGQLLIARRDAQQCEVWVGANTRDSALAEVARRFGVLRIVRLPADELAQAINQAYERNDGSAAQVVGEVEGEVDLSRLMQDIPEVEDLLESEDDAP